jgi:hypothetical protein
MRIKTQAIVINEETYSIAAATLPGAFVEIPFENIDGCWLIINMPAQWGGDEYHSPVVRLENGWLTGDEFSKNWKIINRKPGALAASTWYPVERIFDEDLAKQLNGKEDEDGPFTRRVISNQKIRRHLPGKIRS